MIVLPVQKSVAHSRFRCTIDQELFQFELNWNMRAGWFLSMADVNGNVIFGATRIVGDWDMLGFCTAPTRPRGALFCLDSTGQHAAPGFTDMGTRHELVYLTQDEVDTITTELEAGV